MGYRWEVLEWWRDITKGQDYKYHTIYYGDNLIKAVWHMVKCKRDGAGAVKLVWR